MNTHRYVMLLVSLVAILTLSGCADTELRREDWAAVSRSGASRAYDKMRDHEVLNLSDIEDLSRHHVDPHIIVRYVRGTGAVYYLKDKQIHRMRKNGVDDEVIDYLVATGRNYQTGPYTPAYYPYNSYYPYGYDPVNDPLYGSFNINFFGFHGHHDHGGRHDGFHGGHGGHHHH
jgi:hypothetical protein